MSRSDAQQVEQALHELARKELIRRLRTSSIATEIEHVFWHGIVRDVAYSQIPRAARAEKHLRAAAWIESNAGERTEEHAEVLAHHYLAAMSLQKAAGAVDPAVADRGRLVLRDAGHRARSLGAYAAAARFYSAALELWPSTGEGRAQLLFRYGDAINVAEGSAPDALIEARDALLAEGNTGEAAEAELFVAADAFDHGDGARGVEHMRNAIKLVEPLGDSRSKSLVLGVGSHRMVTAGVSVQHATELVRDALRIARTLGDRELETIALNGLGLVVRDPGVAIPALEEALEVAQEVGPFHTVRACGNLASLLADFGQIVRSADLHERGLAVARGHVLPTYRRWLEAERAIDQYLLGRWKEAEAELDTFLVDIEGSPTFMESPVRAFRALLSLARGDFDRAESDAERSVALARQSVEQQVVFPALATFGRVALEAGREREAAAVADEIARESSKKQDVLPGFWFFNLAVVLTATGRAADVSGLTTGVTRTPWVEAGSAFAQGDFSAASEVLRRMGCRSEAAYVRLCAAEATVSSGEAERELALARDFYVEVGATGYLARTERLRRRPA
jgi:tetratricopeptide (TPR) repeat protein